MRALVSGDRGFLGRHFTAGLQQRGYEIFGCDTRTSPGQDCRRLFANDLRLGTLPHFDLVVHCAAVVGGRALIDGNPLATAESLSIDADAFRWAAAARPGRLLYLSSSAAYPVSLQSGYSDGPPLRESSVDVKKTRLGMPDQVYGWSKVTGELLADRLRETGVPVTVVRPFSGYGADQDETYPFRAILERVRRRENPLTVWGSGEQVRDWIHVDDLVAGALAVADSGTADPVNLCTGRGTSFLGLARTMAAAAGYEPEIRTLPDRPAGVACRVGDPERMHIYYRPQMTLTDGIFRALGVVPTAKR